MGSEVAIEELKQCWTTCSEESFEAAVVDLSLYGMVSYLYRRHGYKPKCFFVASVIIKADPGYASKKLPTVRPSRVSFNSLLVCVPSKHAVYGGLC